MRRRVAITGWGLISCAGPNAEAARPRLLSGECCLNPIQDPRAQHLRARFAGLIDDSDLHPVHRALDPTRVDRHVALALAAAGEALRMARLNPESLGRRMALVFSTCSGAMLLLEEHYRRLLHGDTSDSTEELEARRYYSGAHVLARHLRIGGPVNTVVTACSASTAAIALAADLIRAGAVDTALAGGADAFAWSTLAGFDGLKATTRGRCAPFSKPKGLNLSEGGAFVVLEAMDISSRRGVPIRGEILGAGMSSDALHPSAPDPSGRGLAAAMLRAIEDAGVTIRTVGYLNAHGTGTEANDKAEAKAIQRVFGPPASQPPVSSSKSQIGHNLGAAGAAEIITALICAENATLPTNANFSVPREGCPITCVTRPDRPWPVPRVFLKNNLAFGGHNASLVIDACPDIQSPEAKGPGPYHGEIHVTGCGMVTSLGIGWDALDEGLRTGRSGLSRIPFAGLDHLTAGLVREAEVENFDRRLNPKGMDRSSRWAALAALLAIRDAGYSQRPAALAQLGIYLHLAAGPSWAESEYLTSYLAHDQQVNQLAAFPYIVPCSVTGNVSRALLLTGHSATLCSGPGAGLSGLLHAQSALRAGHTRALLSGAVDELTERILSDLHHAGHLTESPSQPPGEGAAVWLVEAADHARLRQSKPHARLLGAAAATEIPSPPSTDAPNTLLADLVQQVLREARVRPEEIDGLCTAGCRERIDNTLARWAPARGFARSDLARRTGRLDAAQPLLDLSAAWRNSSASLWLGILSSPEGQHEVVLLKRFDR